jgi:uncharacterized protein YjbI with pentapeptide repeats
MTITAAELRMRLTQPLPIGEAVMLSALELNTPLVLDGLDLSSFDLTGAVFREPVSLRGARLHGLSWFKRCIFEAGADFSGTTFANDARFDGAVFKQGLHFAKAEIYGATDFSGCHLHGKVNFDLSVFFGNLSLASIQCDAHVSMRHTECLGGLWASGARFAKAVDTVGMDVHGRLWLRDIQPGKQKNFGQTLASRINAYGYQWL